jgi:TonB family protein
MRFAPFAIVMSLLPGIVPAQDTKPWARLGQQAVNAGAYTTAVYFLKGAVAGEPRHPSAWGDLCRAYLDLDQVDAAIDACLRQIDVNPQSPGVNGLLGRALWRKGKRDEAISALQQQIEVDPRDISAHRSLGHSYCELGRYAEAVAELEKAVALDPKGAGEQGDLGDAYLGLGQVDKGLAILNKLAEEHPVASTLNNVAYRLAAHGVRLDLAERYAQTAVTTTATALIAGAEEPPSLSALRQVVLLTTYWDTLGWIHFKQGDLDKADKFITAAWSANPSGRAGDHLGQLYERRGQKQQAIHAYAMALAARDTLPETRRRLEALVSARDADGLVARAGDDLVALRTIPAAKLLPEKATADFYVVQAQKPAVAEAQFIRGDERLRPLTKSVQDLTPAAVFPEAIPPKIVRRGTLSCPGQGGDCSIELLPAPAAVFAELNAIPPNTHFASELLPGGQGVYRVGGGITAPVPLYRPEPQYSKEALNAKYQGTVVLYVEVDPTGQPRNIKVVRALGLGLDEKAVEAVGKWRFRPGMKDGQPVTVAATIEVNFRLLKDQ